MISAKHFMFMSYDKSKMKTTGAGSGSYTLKGNTYTEHIDFIDVGGGDGLAGTDAVFTVKVDGDLPPPPACSTRHSSTHRFGRG
jgi:hypothetical protein